ncbi:MAG: PIN domain-containing protein [Candidatus Eremiobacterota bacterium]
MNEVFIDSDIILDLLMKREPHYLSAAKLFTIIEKGNVKAFVSPLIFSNLFYILRKITSKERAKNSLKKLKFLVNILEVNEYIIELSLEADFNDFEDAIQYYTALENKIDCLITRNKKDYKKSLITICTAEEYILNFSGK